MGRLTAVGAGQPQRHLGTAEAEPDAGFDVCEVAYTSAISTKRTTQANDFIVPASVILRSTFTTKGSITAKACRAGDSSSTSDCQITLLEDEHHARVVVRVAQCGRTCFDVDGETRRWRPGSTRRGPC